MGLGDIMQQRLYYAHSMKAYGSAKELKDLVNIKNQFPKAEIVNPANENSSDMQHYLNLVKSCDIFVMTEYSKYVGRGVYEEYVHALNERKEVWLLRVNRFVPKVHFSLSVYNRHDWKVEYAKVRMVT